MWNETDYFYKFMEKRGLTYAGTTWQEGLKWRQIWFIDLFKKNDIDCVMLTLEEIEDYKHEWFEKFVPVDRRERASECCDFDYYKTATDFVAKYSSLMWHVFSYKILQCYECDEASEQFDGTEKSEAVLFLDGFTDTACRIKDISKLKAKSLEIFDDVIITANDFAWTYAKTHEVYCGPYFYRPPMQDMPQELQ